MGDDGSGDEDPWFERVTDPDSAASDPSEPSVDDDEQSVQSTDQWECVRPDESPPDRRDNTDGERVWNRFEEGGETNAASDPPRSRADTDANSDAERSDGTDGPERSDTGAESPSPLSADRPSGEGHDGTSPAPDVPAPPGVDGLPDDADAPPGPARRDIREMQPLYKRRSAEFYALWLVAALSYGLGDMVTTSVVFVTPLVGESNPFVALVLEQFGLVGFVAMKLLIFGVLITIGVKGAIDDDRISYYGPPVLAILIGLGLTVWNLITILGP